VPPHFGSVALGVAQLAKFAAPGSFKYSALVSSGFFGP
jgi:hypothetical protein